MADLDREISAYLVCYRNKYHNEIIWLSPFAMSFKPVHLTVDLKAIIIKAFLSLKKAIIQCQINLLIKCKE